MRLSVPSLAAAVAVLAFASGFAAGQADAPKKPIDQFREVRDRINEGKFEVAAEQLADFVALKPADQDYLDIEAKFGPTSILKLRNIPRYFDDAKREAAFRTVEPKGVLEQVIAGSIQANQRLTRDPKRVARFVRNLGETREEKLFALQELKRGGDVVVQPILEALRMERTPELDAGIGTAIRELGSVVVPGLLASVDGLPADQKMVILRGIAARPDLPDLALRIDADPTPRLWYLAGGKTSAQAAAVELLRRITGGRSDAGNPAAELVAAATPCFLKKAKFLAADGFADKLDKQQTEPTQTRVKLWEWDAAGLNAKPVELAPADAEERIGLKYLKWAVELKPGFEPAEELFVALATERAVERANFVDLAKSAPAVYQLLADAPVGLLSGLLEQAYADNKTALAFGLIQAFGDRGERSAAVGKPGRPSLLARGLNYPDSRVQLAAAVALLKAPAGTNHGANARIVEVLGRAIAGEPPVEGKTSRGRALICDPRAVRADAVSELLRDIGYETEHFGTSRELIKRVGRAADFDLVLLDRHAVDPGLTDVLAQLRADANFGRRPVLIVASADRPQPVGLEPLLVRLVALIAATETTDVSVPPIPVYDVRKSRDDFDTDRKRNAEERDRAFKTLFDARLGRAKRIVAASNVVTNDQLRGRLALRLPQLTYAALAAEYDPSQASAPELFRQLKRLTNLIASQSDLDGSVDNVNTESLVKLILQLESALTKPLTAVFETVRGRMDIDGLLVRYEAPRDLSAEVALTRQVRGFAGVAVIPEPYSRFGFQTDIKAVYTDATQLPRSPAEKKESAKTAVEWLKKLATGQIPGFDIRPAAAALRSAFANDDLADPAVDAVAKIGTAEAQQDLLKVALTGTRPAPLRLKAADAANRHVQEFGKLTSGEQLGVLGTAFAREPNLELRAKLAVVRAALSGTGGDLSSRILQFPVGGPPAVKEVAPAPKDPPPSKDGDK